MHRIKFGIALHGGGFRGAYEAGAMERIYEELDGRFRINAIAGDSIGAVNAAVFAGARGDPIGNLKNLWDRLSMDNPGLSIMGHPAMYSVNPMMYTNPFLTDGMYSTAPLLRTLDEFVDFDKLNSDKSPWTAAIAVNAETHKEVVFKNRGMALRAEHIQASCSLAPFFRPTYIDGKPYIDGEYIKDCLNPVIEGLTESKEKNTKYVIFDIKLFSDDECNTTGGMHIDKLITVPYTVEGENISATMDCSRSSIRKRWEAGYQTADKAIKESGLDVFL